MPLPEYVDPTNVPLDVIDDMYVVDELSRDMRTEADLDALIEEEDRILRTEAVAHIGRTSMPQLVEQNDGTIIPVSVRQASLGVGHSDSGAYGGRSRY